MKLPFAVLATVAAAGQAEDDDAAMLSVSAIHDSLRAASEEHRVATAKALAEVSGAQDPRRAADLIQEFALNRLATGVAVNGVDEKTRTQLIQIRDMLTNETYIALEQAHRRDQDLLNKHARAINECGQAHIKHLQQDVNGFEVNLVRDIEDKMYTCRGFPEHSEALLQKRPQTGSLSFLQLPGNGMETETWRDHAMDRWGNYDPTMDPDGKWALQAARSAPNKDQIHKGIQRGVHAAAHAAQGNAHRFWSNWTGVNDPKWDDPDFKSLQLLKIDMFAKCDALDEFIRALPHPNCVPPLSSNVMEVPTCSPQPVGVDADLFDWFTNMKENALFYQGQWRELRAACNAAREAYDDLDAHCDRKQRQYEQSYCSYRQGLHATCAEYQGCHVMNEEQYKALIQTVQYNSDSRKIDWKAIHKLECYINVLISDEVNEVRSQDLLNCEAGNLNTIETILTGFNETNYLSMIIPEINVSCWDLDVPQYIDFKECDMSSVSAYPCTDKWLDRYNGLESPEMCGECSPIPEDFQYTMQQEHVGATSDEYGGGWYFVNELGRDDTNINDLTSLSPGGYHLPKYVTGNLRWNEVLVERVSGNWCDSWGAQTGQWAEAGGASMCIQSDGKHVYCMNNKGGGHSWRQQPISHFTALCGKEGQPACECWPKNKNEVCWAYGEDATGPTKDNVEAPDYVKIRSMKDDGSVVKISFQGEEKQGILRVGNYNSFVQDAEGCRAITPVKYRVYVRCLGCSHTNTTDFHTKDGMHFLQQMEVTHMTETSRSQYTYEAWFKSPLDGKYRREIIGGSSSGLTLVNEGAVECLHDIGRGIAAGHKQAGYQLHVGGTDKFGAVCFEPDTFYHVAVSKDIEGVVRVFVNGKDVTATGQGLMRGPSTLEKTIGGGFTDGGQLFNVRIWDYARTQTQLYQDAFITSIDAMFDASGLAHWWPLTKDTKDVMTGVSLKGPEVRYAPVWCSDLEASGMCGC
jgi:hypothetical protein